MACKKTGICVIDDDISAIRQSLILCDLAVIACPTYFANVTAPLKNMFDRLVATLMDDNGGAIPKPKLLKRQNYILLTTCNTPAPLNRLGGQSTDCLKAMNDMLPHLELFDQLESGELRQALEQLKEREIHILTMKVLDDRSFQEIADETGLGYKTISSIYYRLIQKLRDELRGENK